MNILVNIHAYRKTIIPKTELPKYFDISMTKYLKRISKYKNDILDKNFKFIRLIPLISNDINNKQYEEYCYPKSIQSLLIAPYSDNIDPVEINVKNFINNKSNEYSIYSQMELIEDVKLLIPVEIYNQNFINKSDNYQDKILVKTKDKEFEYAKNKDTKFLFLDSFSDFLSFFEKNKLSFISNDQVNNTKYEDEYYMGKLSKFFEENNDGIIAMRFYK